MKTKTNVRAGTEIRNVKNFDKPVRGYY